MSFYTLAPELPSDISKELEHVSELQQKLLFLRGITTKEEASEFLNPDYSKQSHDPFLLKGMDIAVKRILEALEQNERITIFSDYDTDGIPGAVVLSDFFRKIGYQYFDVYIPHRNNEGFGLNMEAVSKLAENGTQLLITIDCGITDVVEVEHAKSLGIDVIITDHHLPHDDVPKAVAIVNPKQSDCAYPFKQLCGAGVVYKLVQALIEKGDFDIHEGWEKWLLDMVGIATLSDMVPLKGENRILAYFGLMVLRKTPRPGLLKLFHKTRTSQKHLDEGDVGFTIGPRINAASRMDEPMDAYHLLSATDEVLAGKYYDHLDSLNNERKGIVASMVKALKKKIKARSTLNSVIVSGDPEWKPSLLGLACNSLVEEYKRPVFLWGGTSGSKLKGSCRSIGDINLVDIMKGVPEGVFTDFGGHAMSGGFTLSKDYIHTLEEELSKVLDGIDLSELGSSTVIDHELSLHDISWSLYDEIDRLAPFGVENPRPLFRVRDALVRQVTNFGKQKNHLKLLLEDHDGFASIEAIQFFKTRENYPDKIIEGERVSLIAHVEKSTFGYKPQLRLRIVDVE